MALENNRNIFAEELSSEGIAVIAAKDLISCELIDEIVILNQESGVYYGLNQVGAFIWNLLKVSRTVDEMRDLVINEFEVSSDLARQDVLELLRKMADKGLVDISMRKDRSI